MGCDIHTQAEKRIDGKWTRIDGLEPFDWRSYGMYAFLAGVRNYSAVTPIAEPRGLPADADYTEDAEHWLGEHSFSWLSIDELLTFDYTQTMEDRRVTRQLAPNFISGAETCEPGEGEKTTYRDFLGDGYFEDLQKLKDAGAERVIFGFDS
jgi:hypothetical protein